MYGATPRPPAWSAIPPHLRGILVVLGIVILAFFVVEKLVYEPNAGVAPSAVLTRIAHHDAKSVTVQATVMRVEFKDGTTQRVAVTADRDLWPALKSSGADITIEGDDGAVGAPGIGYVVRFVPFIVMALLLIFVLRQRRTY